MKKIQWYEAGEEIPEGAIYLGMDSRFSSTTFYFLVEVKE